MQSRQLLIDNGTWPALLEHVERIERISQLTTNQVEAYGGRVDRQVFNYFWE
jgi:hypothetical protein